MKDNYIIREVRAARHKIAVECGFDPEKILRRAELALQSTRTAKLRRA